MYPQVVGSELEAEKAKSKAEQEKNKAEKEKMGAQLAKLTAQLADLAKPVPCECCILRFLYHIDHNHSAASPGRLSSSS